MSESNVVVLPARTDSGTIEDRLQEMTNGNFVVAAFEIYDHAEAVYATRADAERYGVDEGAEMGVWVLGRREDIYEWCEKHDYQDFQETYSAGYDRE